MNRDVRSAMVPTEFEPKREKENVNPFREFYLDFLVTENEADRVAVLKQVVGKLEELIRTRGHLTEYEERYVDHIQRSVRNIGKEGRTENIKGLTKKMIELKKKTVEKETGSSVEAEFDDIFPGLTEQQIKIIIQESKAFQFTKGCNVGCTRCGHNRIKGVRKNISWLATQKIVQLFRKHNIVEKFRKRKVKPLSYMASDSGDYRTKDNRTMVDVNRLFLEETGISLQNGLMVNSVGLLSTF